ncbi:MAG: DEAD/DEAH box helicase [Chloroflexi bacterium]|nr:DEAD/DEAH box helicase [Chloroflexota bacterium]
MQPSVFLSHLQSLPGYRGQIVHVERMPARAPRYGRLERPLPPALAAALRRRGIRDLYTHQAQAINAVRRGENVVVSTSTASGKTLCYNLPVLEAIIKERQARALYLFPTKALAQDQLRSLRELTDEAPSRLTSRNGGRDGASEDNLPGLKYGTFDGDTPQAQRGRIKKTASIVLSNPDMLSLGILPNHTSWARFFSNLKFVVIDEAHAYRGVFGSHVANVIRRLRRVARFYGANPQFICCSATIANPQEHVARLIGLPVTVVDDDGSPHGPKEFVFWNPPFLDEARSARKSANTEATLLFTELVQAGIRNITFAKTRKLAELILLYARDSLAKDAPELVPRIAAYRAGYRPEDRRQIERALFNGQLVGVTATNALELGVDIGDLDATVLTGYPGTVASTWQQAGRAGRGRDESLSVLIGLDGPLDQYIMRHPQEFLTRRIEHALIDPSNLYLLVKHLACAAYELPLSPEDEVIFGGEVETPITTPTPALPRPTGEGEALPRATPSAFEQAMVALERQGLLRYTGQRWFYGGMDYPAEGVNIRSIAPDAYQVIDRSQGNAVLETVEAATAFFQIHAGAIYLHQGESYLITHLDLYTKNAYAVPTDVNYYTQSKDITDVRIIQSLQHQELGGTHAYWGKVQVTTQVVGFRRKQQFTDTVLSEEPLDLPPQSYETRALWFDIPPAALERIGRAGLDLAGGLHAAEHAAIGLLPLLTMCDRNDIGGLSTIAHPDTGQPQIFIYDGFPGGVGISEKGFDLLPDLWRATLQTLNECPCEDGCPSCVQSPKCGNNNEPLDKQAARVLLGELLRGEV